MIEVPQGYNARQHINSLLLLFQHLRGRNIYKLQALRKLQLSQTSTLGNIIETLDWKDSFSIGSDYIDACLAQILAWQRTSEEPEVAFILNEVPTPFSEKKKVH